MAGNVDALKEQWNPEMMHIKHGKVKNPLIHFPILGLQRRKPLLSNGDVDEQGRKKMVVRQKGIHIYIPSDLITATSFYKRGFIP